MVQVCKAFIKLDVGNPSAGICCDSKIFHRRSGNKCCGNLPFYSRKQVCCDGELADKKKYACCNNKLILKATRICCGITDYIRKANQRCCVSVNSLMYGPTKLHDYRYVQLFRKILKI